MKNILLLVTLILTSLSFSQDILMENGTFTRCAPDKFYDSGGQFGNYSDDENLVTTICPQNAGEFIMVDFTQFNVQPNFDFLTVYDGDDITADVIGTYSANSPGMVSATASNTSGCLTFAFTSNGVININGWEANIICAVQCQTITASIDATIPPAVSGTIEVDPSELITFEGSATFSDDGTGATYTWDFGNGVTLDGEDVNYAYTNPGTYTVTFTATDTNPVGCSDSTSTFQVVVLDNDTCAGALPICGDIEDVPSPVGSGAAESGIDYGCLGSQPRPRWYFLQTGDIPGDLSFTLTQTNGQGGTGGGNDVDFIIWGPFSQPECGSANLNSTTQVDCSFSAAATEQIDIPNAPANQYYVLLITNYSQSAGYINLELNEDPNSDATTNCDIICQVDLGEDQELCNGDSYTIEPDFNGAFNSFEWQLDGETIPGETGSTLTVTESGTYTLLVEGLDAVFGDPCSTQDDIEIAIVPPFSLNDISVTECGQTATTADFNLDAEIVDILSPLDPADYTVSFHNNLDDAENAVAAITGTNPYSGTDGEIIYVRVEATGTNCFSTSMVTLAASSQPTINPASDLELCDDVSNNGTEQFDLDSQTLVVLGTQVAADFNVTYHLSFDEADMGNNALPLSYTNTMNPQPIYVRIASASDVSCYNASTDPVFDLVVNARAIANTPPDMLECDTVGNDGLETFDLSSQEAVILGDQDPGTFSVTFHNTIDDAENGVANLPTSYQNVTPNQETIYVRVDDPVYPDCYTTTSFDLVINTLPALVGVPALQVCDDDMDGFVGFPLSTREAELLNGQTGIEVSFHESLVGAETDDAEIFDGYVNTSMTNQTVFVRLENTTTNCYNVNTLQLEVVVNPIANVTTALEVCDDNADGFAEFNLSLKDAEVIGSQSGMTVSYYADPADAELGDNPLPTTYTNATPGVQEVSVRIENGATGCYATTTLQLIVNPKPLITTVTAYELCDDNLSGDEEEDFDLSTKTAEILNGQVNVAVNYYANEADADAGINEITGPYTNISNPQTVVAILTNTNTNCISTTTFELIVNPLPAITSPTALEVCDDGTADGITEMDLSLKNAEVTGNNPNYSISYYETLADLQSGADPLPTLYTNTSNGQVVIVYVEDINTGCSATTTLELVVEQAPVAFTPSPLRYCDPDNDGFGMFDLAGTANEITGGASGLTVTYHETQTNADNGVDAIDTTVSYNNIVQDAQTLYVRVESATIATDCATIVVLELIVEPTPQLMAPTPLEACDDISADGFAVFNLTDKADEILNGQDPTRYILSYYESEANAALAMSPIGNPLAYTNTDDFNQTIWVRVEDNTTVEGCYKLTSLELIVNALPVLVTPAPLELCDAITLDDGQEAFTLEDANAEILNGQTGITLTYYETQSDADNATVPIESPYTNTGNPQTVFVRAENDITGCYNTVTLTLRVNPIPSPEANPDPIEVCDEDNDGFAEFDLEIRTIEVTNGESDVVITYHETQSDAEQGENAITGLYTNIVANNQMIYVRSESTLTGCYNLTLNTLELIVHPAPEVPTSIEPYTICDSDNDGSAQFDLSTKDEEVLNGQEPTTVELTYHVSAANAETGVNPIINVGNYTNNGNPQTIYVRLYDPITTCFDTGMFELIVALPPEAVQPTQLNECDDLGEVPGDEITVFDLRVKDTEITGGNASWSVAYYETSADAQAQENAIPDPTQYTNTEINGLGANPQTLYVVVTDTDTGCVDFTTLTIRVLPNPTPTASDLLPNIERCDEENTGDGTEMFDLTENEDLIRNGENGVTITYHETEDAANAGTDAIPDPTQYTNIETPTQEIYVRMTKDATGCYALVDFTIVVNPLPEVIAVTDFIQCELFTDGTDTFDLGTKDAEVLNGQDEAQFTVSYHDNLTDAEEGMNGLVSPYTNTANPQQIFVAITNNETGCSISTQSFNIEVQEAAQANPDMDPIVFELCDDEMETDGNPLDDSTQFDLTNMDAEVLDGQDPLNYIVTYYATQEDADDKVNPLPTLYENVTNPQVIYARVDNDTPDAVTAADTSICYALAALTLQVNPLPEFDLDESYTLCVNTDGSEVLDPLVIDTGLSATDYGFVWSYEGVEITGETGPSIMPTQGGNYRVDVIDVSTSTQTSCPNFDTTVVMESEPPSITVNVLTQNFAESHVLEVVPGDEIGDYEYSLDNGPWQDGTLFTDVSPGQHHITARDRNGCGTTTEPAFIIDYPLYFTPNGDGRNETWNIESIGNGAKIYIFDRYGKLLKQISPNGTGWNGTYNGSAMPTDGYWFTVEYDEPLTGERKEFRAHFTLKR
ncbi:T9SS type B sorting domain-containing protein [Winogradskyella schleiferi]|uniref:T9SS type B sorting domain-containing protein n=1 Tax=Winogradskyella schleiferi TaxID=2686078 RepID=UPI0015BC6747|nr:T9SS type B sorting domain-containing protein [Winogradskyella schleiferi]